MSLGIDAKASVQQSFPFPIISSGVPGFSVPNIISIGHTIKLEAAVDLGVTLEGQVLAGVKMTISDFSANLDLVDGSKSASKIEPKFEKIFEAKAKIEASAGLGLPLTIGIGIDIPPIKFTKMASITEKPSIAATITYQASTTCEGVGGSGDNKCINGVGYKLEFKNDITADIFGIKQYDLHKFSVPIIDGCEKVPSIGPTTCSSKSSAQSTSAASTGSSSALSTTGTQSNTASETSGSLTASGSTSATDIASTTGSASVSDTASLSNSGSASATDSISATDSALVTDSASQSITGASGAATDSASAILTSGTETSGSESLTTGK